MSSQRKREALLDIVREINEADSKPIHLDDPDHIYAFGLWVSSTLARMQSLSPNFMTDQSKLIELEVDNPNDLNNTFKVFAYLKTLIPDILDEVDRQSKTWQILAGMTSSVTIQQVKKGFFARVKGDHLQPYTNETNWKYLATCLGPDAQDWIDNHRRFMRSLRFCDDDYPNCAMAFLETFVFSKELAKTVPEASETLQLAEWLKANDPSQFTTLYGTETAITPINTTTVRSLANPDAIFEHLERLDNTHETDPRARVGSIKDAIEATAKVIISETGKNPKEDLQALINQVHSHPDLNPKTTTSESKKRVLGGLKSIALGVIEMRNAEGTGHGRVTSTPAHLHDEAELAVDAGKIWINSVLKAHIASSDRTSESEVQETGTEEEPF